MMKRYSLLLVYFLAGCFLPLCPIADLVSLPSELCTEARAQSSNPYLSGNSNNPSRKEINPENPALNSETDKEGALIKKLKEDRIKIDQWYGKLIKSVYNFRVDNISGNLDPDQQIKKYQEALGRKITVGQGFLKKGKRTEATKEFCKILVRYNDEMSLSRITFLYQLNYPQFKKDIIPLLENYCNYLGKNSASNERLAQCFSDLSTAYQDDNQHDKALKMAVDSLELLSKKSGATVWQIASSKQQIGRSYLKAKRFNEALPYLEEADKFWSDSAINFMQIASSMNDTNLFPFSNHSSCSAKEDVYEACIGQGMKEKAIQALAAISNPAQLPEINGIVISQYYRNCQDSFFKLANVYLDDKNYSEGVNTLNPFLNHVKDISYAYSLRSFAFEGNKDFESAKEDLLKVIELDGKRYANDAVRLGDLYLELQQYDDAKNAYKDALKIEPNNPSTLHNLGVCFGRQGQKTIAADYYYRAGIIYLKKNERDGALLALDNLKKIDSQFYDKLFFAIYKEKPSNERSKDKEKN